MEIWRETWLGMEITQSASTDLFRFGVSVSPEGHRKRMALFQEVALTAKRFAQAHNSTCYFYRNI